MILIRKEPYGTILEENKAMAIVMRLYIIVLTKR